MRSRAGALGVGLVLLVAGCGDGGKDPKPVATVVSQDYPIETAALEITVVPTFPDPELRRLVQQLVDLTAVRLTEADYEAHVVRIALEPGVSESQRQRLVRRLTSIAGVVGVAPGPRR